jgi:hypothetical protein
LYASYLSLVIVHAERDADVIFSLSKVSSTGPFFSDDNWDRWSNREVLLNKLKEPPRELSPDTFHHEVQHMEPDGTRTTYVYTATNSKWTPKELEDLEMNSKRTRGARRKLQKNSRISK